MRHHLEIVSGPKIQMPGPSRQCRTVEFQCVGTPFVRSAFREPPPPRLASSKFTHDAIRDGIIRRHLHCEHPTRIQTLDKARKNIAVPLDPLESSTGKDGSGANRETALR